MADKDLVRFHAESLKEYAAFWFDPETRLAVDISEEETAYHLCEHAAMLFRYTGKHISLEGLTSQPREHRRSLILAVCRYLAGLVLIDAARRILSDEVLDADQMTELEDLIIERDAVEEVLLLTTQLAADLVREGDTEVRKELATARSTVAELDDVLWDRQDAISVACRALDGLRAQLARSPDERSQWWFGEAVAIDEAFERNSVLELIGPSHIGLPTLPRDVVPISASLFSHADAPASLAAADTPSGPQLSLNALIPERPEVRVIVTRLSTDTYQFIFIDHDSGERSSLLDDNCVSVSCGGSEPVRTLITAGVAVVRFADAFDSCQIETADHHPVGNLVLQMHKQ